MLTADSPRIGIIGTGFVARHFLMELAHHKDFRLGRILSRRPLDTISDIPQSEALTSSLNALIDESDLIFECTGDVLHATQTIDAIFRAGKPVVTLNPEFHVTTGSWFVGKGMLTEADGDQPGSLARLWEETVAMGFEPIVLGNMKGFLNRWPSREEMAYWSEKQGISLPMVTSFTDGTKLQVEQALVGNYFGAGIAQDELIGPEIDDLNEAAKILGDAATKAGRPITDYVLSRKLPHGVFIIARHKEEQVDALRYLKMGDGPYYTLIRNNIFVHLEVMRTIERLVTTGVPLLHNSSKPEIGVAAVAKRDLQPGKRIERGCGSFDMRGICVRIDEHLNHLPIGLAEKVHVKRRIDKDAIITFDDIEVPESMALSVWREIVAGRLRVAAAA